MATAFERCGGFAAISKIVISFYDRVLDCDEIGHFFDDIDMSRVIDHQTKFIATVMGGPSSYSDEALKTIHNRYAISPRDFERMAELLRETLADHGIDQRDIDHVMREIGRRAHTVITTQA